MFDAVRDLPERRRQGLALLCLGAAAAIGTMTFTREGVFAIVVGPKLVSFAPDMISAILALLVVLPILRGRMTHSHRRDALSVINLFLVFYILAIVSKMTIGGTGGHLSALTETPTALFALVILLLSNVNVGRYGELAVIGLVLLGGWNLVAASAVMGLWGFVFAVASAVGLALVVDFEMVLGRMRPAPAPAGRPEAIDGLPDPAEGRRLRD